MNDHVKQISKKVWVVQGRTNTGVIQLDGRFCLVIDPGQDRESAKLVSRTLEELKLELAGVLITHSHADHYGGTNFLKSNISISYFASEFESSLIEQPLLEPIFLFGGAEPIRELTYKFILAKPVKISTRLQAGEWEYRGVKLNIISLAGHSSGQIGLEYENILFAGDSLTLSKYIEKYKFPFYSDIQKTFDTFDWLENTNYSLLVPGHGEIMNNREYRNETCFNRNYLHRFIDIIKKILNEGPLTDEELLRQVAIYLETPIVTVIQFVLNRTLILAILKYLSQKEEIISYFDDNRWVWKKK